MVRQTFVHLYKAFSEKDVLKCNSTLNTAFYWLEAAALIVAALGSRRILKC